MGERSLGGWLHRRLRDRSTDLLSDAGAHSHRRNGVFPAHAAWGGLCPAGFSRDFSDVEVGFWGAKWIEAAYNAGLIPACETTPELRFCPDNPLDRAMGAYMMVQAKGLVIP